MFYRDEFKVNAAQCEGDAIASESFLDGVAKTLKKALGIPEGVKGRAIPAEAIERITRIGAIGWNHVQMKAYPLFGIPGNEYYTIKGLMQGNAPEGERKSWKTAMLWADLYNVCGRVPQRALTVDPEWTSDERKAAEAAIKAECCVYLCDFSRGEAKSKCANPLDTFSKVYMDRPNRFKETLYEYICNSGEASGGVVSVREVVKLLAGAVDEDADKNANTVKKYLRESFFAEDAVYVWIKVLGFEPDAKDTYTSQETAGAMVKWNSREDFGALANEFLNYFEALKKYMDRVIDFIECRGEEKDREYSWEERDKIGVNVDVEINQFFMKKMKNNQLTHLYTYLVRDTEYSKSKKYDDRVAYIRANMKANTVSDHNNRLSELYLAAKKAVEGVSDRSSLNEAGDGIEEFKKGVALAKKFCENSHNDLLNAKREMGNNENAMKFSGDEATKKSFEDSKKRYEELKQFEEAVDNALIHINDLNEALEVKKRWVRANEDLKRLTEQWQRLQDKITTVADGLKLCDSKLADVTCKADVIKVVVWLDEQEKCLAKLFKDSGSKIYARVNKAGGADRMFIDALIENCRALIQNKMDDPSVPEIADSSAVDNTLGKTVIGNGVNVQFTMVEDHQRSNKKYVGGSYGAVYGYGAYKSLMDAAVTVERRSIFSDYPDIDSYPYLKPFRYQMDNVRAMLTRMGGRGVFGDQVGLGKTLQTIIAADMMFRCGAITNAVIVVREANVYQWRNEIESKFRGEDGKCMFKLFPEAGRRNFYTVDELRTIASRSDFSTKGSCLKIYFLSSNSLQSRAFVDGIEEVGDERLEYDRIRAPFEEFGTYAQEIIDFNRDENIETLKGIAESNLAQVQTLSELKALKAALNEQLINEINADEKIRNHRLRGGDYRLVAFDVDKTAEFQEEQGRGLFKPLDTYYNPILGVICRRIAQLEHRRDELLQLIHQFDIGAIGLLIFDEVQEIIDKLNDGGDDVHDAVVLRDFVANVNKKYCILISATPIKNDLSDIFELLYMVDKNRLGSTREEAEEKFYRVYCGNCRTLADMANASDRDEKFKLLNCLINSLFTRKRIYDPDVVKSMLRHSATAAERKLAEEKGVDDYGGARFELLLEALNVAYEYEEALVCAEDRAKVTAEYSERLAGYSAGVYGEFGMKTETFVKAVLDMVRTVNQAVINEFYQNDEENDFKKFNIYRAFLVNKKKLLEAVEKRSEDGIRTFKKFCNQLISCINRGLISFYMEKHDYSVKFLFDYLDWTRPLKRAPEHGDIPEMEFSNAEEKIAFFADMLNDNRLEKGMSHDKKELKFGKIVFYDKSNAVRKALYRGLKNCDNSAKRRVYLTLSDEDMESGEFTAEDMVYLGCFGANGNAYSVTREKIAEISAKPAEERTSAESRYLAWYNSERNLAHSDRNFREFSKFVSEDGNVNAICLIDSAQTVGTDFNSANVLCIGQLDNGNGEYLDPIDFEQLIGRVSRLGQTSTCLIYTCPYNGGDNGEGLDVGFNRAYYDLLTDPEGFDILGAGSTEISFAQPVITACLRRLFSKNAPGGDDGDFTAEFAPEVLPIDPDVKSFAEIFRYAYTNSGLDKIKVKVKGETAPFDAVEGMKLLIRNYVKIISTPLAHD